MAQITLKNVAGKSAGQVDLDDATFGIEPNVHVMHQVVTAQLAARRAGTQSTKTRSEVRGGGAKPYRQKGTGNARQGSIRSPQFSGGGVALGPKPRSYAQKTPKKMVKLALRSALSDRANEGKVVVVDAWGWDAPSTKAAKAALAGLGIDGTVLVVVGRDDAAAALSFRNLPEVQLVAPAELNAYDVLSNEYVVFTADTLPAPAAEAPTSEVADAATVEAEEAPVASSEFEPTGWPGGVKADAEGNGPETHLIKGNADSMLYHVPGSSHYRRTKAEVWFDTEGHAEAAGFRKPASQRTEGDDES
jgi:large subunit ribosomal protein L4